ncbi:MAG: hypothetical protein J6866_00815 [Victivallales bacterium]|nr:hypothetical protein [Victivallales bacterium]
MKNPAFVFLLLAACLAFGKAGVQLPPGWEPLAGAQNNMSLYAQVEAPEGSRIETPGSVLAVFDAEGVCRGAAAVEEGPCGKWYQLTVVSNTTTDIGLALKVLDSRSGEVFDLKERIDFQADMTIPATDYTSQPLVLHVKPLTAELTLTLVQNWNWISFNVEQGERTILEFLEDYTQYATDGDIIKSQNGQATYSGGQWYASPKNFRLEPGRMYKLRKQSAGHCTMTVTGTPCTGSETIAVVAGWNWIGFTGETEAPVGALSKAEGFVDNDLVKPQSGAQATYSGGRWYGNLVFRPGLGYMLKQAAAGTVTFGNP